MQKKEAKAQVEPTAHLRATSGPTSCTPRRAEHEQQHRPRPRTAHTPGTHISETRAPRALHHAITTTSLPLPPTARFRSSANESSISAGRLLRSIRFLLCPFSSVLPPLRRRRLVHLRR
uniref:Uncharacterized protein n=1 Tax=Aegilops tauschii subsp. strangulata TaxID=200361 RepID=A0A452XRB9_AEGTS